jgi:hypothetical protein
VSAPANNSVPPPSGEASGDALREFVMPLEGERRGVLGRVGEHLLRLSALGAILVYDRMLQQPLRLPLGTLQLGLVELGGAEGRFPILRRLSDTAVIPREQGVEGWLWTRSGGSAMTMLGDEDAEPNAALLFTKPLAEELVVASFRPEALEALVARSPLGVPTVHGFLFRTLEPSRAEVIFRQFGLLRPLTDREVAPTLRRSLPTDRSADPVLQAAEDPRAATSVAPPGLG